MANLYGLTRGAAGAMRGWREAEQTAFERERVGRREDREQQTWERQEKEARRVELRRQAGEDRAKALHELQLQNQKLDISNRELDYRLRSGAVADDKEKRRLDMIKRKNETQKALNEAAISAMTMAKEGIDPGETATPQARRQYERAVRNMEQESREEGLPDALRLLIGGDPRAAERVFNNYGIRKIELGSLRPTPDPNDPEWMFEYRDQDTGELLPFNAQTQASLLGGGIAPETIGGRQVMRFWDKAAWEERFKQEQQTRRTELSWGGGRGSAGMYAIAKQMEADGVVPDVQTGMRILQAGNPLAQARMLAQFMVKQSYGVMDVNTAMQQAQQSINRYLGVGVTPPPGGGTPPPGAGSAAPGAGSGAGAGVGAGPPSDLTLENIIGGTPLF